MLVFPIQLSGVALGTCGLGLLLANINQSGIVPEGIIRVVVLITTSLSLLLTTIYICFNIFLQGPRIWFKRELNNPRQCSAFGALIMHLSMIAYILTDHIHFPSSFYFSYILGYFAAMLQVVNMIFCYYLLRHIAIQENVGILSRTNILKKNAFSFSAVFFFCFNLPINIPLQRW